MSAAYYGVTGAAEHTVGLYTRREAVVLRVHALDRLEQLGHPGPGKPVNFTVVGGGATVVQLAGALAELRALDEAHPKVDWADENIRLVEMAPALLAPFHPKLQANALAELRRRGVDIRLNSKIREITENRVILATGTSCPATSRSGRPRCPRRPGRPTGACRRATAAGSGSSRAGRAGRILKNCSRALDFMCA